MCQIKYTNFRTVVPRLVLCIYIKNPRMVFVGRNQRPSSFKPLPWPGTPSPEAQTLQCCCSFGKPLIIKKMFAELIQTQSRCCLGTEQLPAWLLSCQTGGSLAGQEQQPSWQQKSSCNTLNWCGLDSSGPPERPNCESWIQPSEMYWECWVWFLLPTHSSLVKHCMELASTLLGEEEQTFSCNMWIPVYTKPLTKPLLIKTGKNIMIPMSLPQEKKKIRFLSGGRREQSSDKK